MKLQRNSLASYTEIETYTTITLLRDKTDKAYNALSIVSMIVYGCVATLLFVTWASSFLISSDRAINTSALVKKWARVMLSFVTAFGPFVGRFSHVSSYTQCTCCQPVPLTWRRCGRHLKFTTKYSYMLPPHIIVCSYQCLEFYVVAASFTTTSNSMWSSAYTGYQAFPYCIALRQQFHMTRL